MSLRVYNTLSREKEEFRTVQPGKVGMYLCGPTVYKPSHVGHMVGPVIFDTVRRYLRYLGYEVSFVVNITDVDDKLINRANELGTTVKDLAESMTADYVECLKKLNVTSIDRMPKATEHIAEMIEIVRRLEEKGLAYKAEDGSVYFAIARFPTYGKLSRLDTREIRAGARVAADDYNKEDVRDFALWKAVKPEDEKAGAAWDSPWGRGRPGWHLECSAMAKRYLGDTLDLHAGGVDLIFPHHEDEIAQSEGANGVPFARVWSHGEFLLTDGAKMAKRVGNVSTVQDLRDEGIPAAALRYFVFTVHYRKQLNLTSDALEASVNATRRVGEFGERLARASGGTETMRRAADELETKARAALFDDLNAPEAMGALFTFLNRVNAELDARGKDLAALARAREAFALVNGVLDLIPESASLDAGESAWVEERIAARNAARAKRDFAAADAIRKELEARSIAIEDTPQGTRWKKLR